MDTTSKEISHKNVLKGHFYACATGVIWGPDSILVKLGDTGSMYLNLCLRAIFSVSFMLSMLFWDRGNMAKLDWRQYWSVGHVYGYAYILASLGVRISFTVSIILNSVADTVFVGAIEPFVALVLSRMMLGMAIKPVQVLLIIGSVIGVVIVILGEHGGDSSGVFHLSWTLLIPFILPFSGALRNILLIKSEHQLKAVNCAMMADVLLFFLMIPFISYIDFTSLLTKPEILLPYMGIGFISFLGIWLPSQACKYISPADVSMWGMTEFLSAMAFNAAVYYEYPSLMTVAGGVLITLMLYFNFYIKQRNSLK